MPLINLTGCGIEREVERKTAVFCADEKNSIHALGPVYTRLEP
jgi:hypothetical protein